MLTKLISNNIESRVCPACGNLVNSTKYEYLYNDKKNLILHCSHCTLMFANEPMPLIEDRQMKSIDDAELYNPNFKKLHKILVLRREINEARKLLGNGKISVLDIGCGTGWTSAYWQQKGFCVTGLEPSSERGNIAVNRYGIRIIPSFLEHTELTNEYDIVILRHVIEHFANPFDMVTKAGSALSQHGLMMIVVPNIDCIGRYIFDTDWTWVLPWHCNFFNPTSLVALLLRAGFEPVKLYQTPSPLYYSESFIRKFPSSILSKFVNKHGLASLSFSAPLALLGLIGGHGDNITVIARKIN